MWRADSHVLSTHPGSGARGAATVDYTLPATPAGGRWCRLEASVAINDKNNFFGKAGSPLTFSVVDISGCAAACPRSYAEPVLWQSNPVQNTEVVQSLRVELPPVRKNHSQSKLAIAKPIRNRDFAGVCCC